MCQSVPSLVACVLLVAACDGSTSDAGEEDDMIDCGPAAPICGEPVIGHPCGCGSPGQLSQMNGQTYSCKPDGCLEPIPYPPGCIPLANACGDFFGTWSLSYAMWQRRTDDELDGAGIASGDAGAAADDIVAIKRCEPADSDGWSSLKITNGPDGICVDIDQGSFPDAVVQTGGCDPAPGTMLDVAKTTTWTSSLETYRADSTLELSLTWPGKALGTWKTVVSGSGQCTMTASVAAVLER
jgi:hypothetical protein